MMIQSQPATLFQELLQNDAADALAWLRGIESGKQKPPENFNWLGFAEVAAFNAHTKSNLLWAEIAISVYDRLAKEANDKANDASKESTTIAAMMLRAASIADRGSIEERSRSRCQSDY